MPDDRRPGAKWNRVVLCYFRFEGDRTFWPREFPRRMTELAITDKDIPLSRGGNIPLVVVSGLPASGKSTLSRRLAPALNLPLIDKDDILEGLFESLGTGDSDWRKRLSRASDDVLERVTRSSSGAVIASFWRHRGMLIDSGTPTDWLALISQRIVEVYCECDPDVAAARFINRSRHPGHLDFTRPREEVVARFRALAGIGALEIGKLLRVDTSRGVDADAVVAEVRTCLSQLGL